MKHGEGGGGGQVGLQERLNVVDGVVDGQVPFFLLVVLVVKAIPRVFGGEHRVVLEPVLC